MVLIVLTCMMLSGCWNYREIDQLSIVAGLCVDKKGENQYEFTVELIKISGENQTAPRSQILSMTGETMFDAARNIISTSGQKLYWSHANILIVSEEIAKEGIATILDWYLRDAETRPDIPIAIASTERAKDIFLMPEQDGDIISNRLSDTIKNHKGYPNFPPVEMWEFANHLGTEGVSAFTPRVVMVSSDKGLPPMVDGSAIFHHDKLAGYLSGLETKYALFVRDDIRGGILVEEVEMDDKIGKVSLEIFDSKTSVKPTISGNDITMDIKVETVVAIGEIMGDIDFIDEPGRSILEKEAEESLRENIIAVIKKVQEEYACDIFAFGDEVYKSYPKVWDKIKGNWQNIFPDVQVSVTCDILIENSGLTSRPLKVTH